MLFNELCFPFHVAVMVKLEGLGLNHADVVSRDKWKASG